MVKPVDEISYDLRLKNNTDANIFHDMNSLKAVFEEDGKIDPLSAYTHYIKYYMKYDVGSIRFVKRMNMNRDGNSYNDHALMMHPYDAICVIERIIVDPVGRCKLLVEAYL